MTPRIEAAKASIAHNARECVEALQCADTAERAGMAKMAASFRKLAAFHAGHAWAWVPALRDDGILRGNADLVPALHATAGTPA